METLLIHEDLLNGSFFTDVCQMLKQEGVSPLTIQETISSYDVILQSKFNLGSNLRRTKLIEKTHLRPSTGEETQIRIRSTGMRHRNSKRFKRCR